jgi:hypothetical protein
MLTSARSPLGAPGAFALPDARAVSLHPQRMDVCAFVGVAPRGPAYVPLVDAQWPSGVGMVTQLDRPLQRSVAVPVRSFDDYRLVFGGFEGPGCLPHAVASYFEQGGRMAWVVRIVPTRAAAALGDDCAKGSLTGAFSTALALTARNEGSWGNRLQVRSGFTGTAVGFEWLSDHRVLAPLSTPVTAGSVLRIVPTAGEPVLTRVLSLAAVRDEHLARSSWQLVLDVDVSAEPLSIELVEAWVAVSDGAGRSERFERLALSAQHPQGLATVLCEQSTLLWPDAAWADQPLMPLDARIEFLQGVSTVFEGGVDAYAQITPDDFFDASWSVADDLPGSGLMALAPVDGVAIEGTASITQVVVPDLYVPAQWATVEPVPETEAGSAGATFAPCVDVVSTAAVEASTPSLLSSLVLDPRHSSDLATIIALQQQVVSFCEATQSLIALLDVPPGLSQARIEQWRSRFDTSWAAAYHPWLQAARRPLDGQDPLLARERALPPSAVAAGIVARRELARGIQFGPANEIARQVINVAEPVNPGRADALHPLGINCFVREAAGISLVAARTLSQERDWRQLSVRRLMLMLRRTLLVETQWAVFEPNGPTLWSDLQHAIESLLRGLFRVGAFAGRTEAESFFVRVLTEGWRLDRGELLIEVGVAPAEPLEFILVRLRRQGDGTLNLEGNADHG